MRCVTTYWLEHDYCPDSVKTELLEITLPYSQSLSTAATGAKHDQTKAIARENGS
jgi:hypothetical protein